MSQFMRFSLLLLVFTLTLVAGPALAEQGSTLTEIQQRGQLILGTSGNMPTMSQRNAAGKLEGFDIDMARVMADAMGVKLVIEVMPFDQLLTSLESGKVDVVISNMTITPKRNLRVAFVGPYLTSGKCFVTKDKALASASESSQDLNTAKTRLAVLKGSTSEDFARELLPQATVVEIEDYAVAAEMVKSDEVSGMLTDYPICLSTLKDNPDAGFVSVFSLLTYEPIGIALPANDAQFINWTHNFLNRLDGIKALDAMSKRWFGRIGLKR